MEQASQIVDFFQKPDEIKKVKNNIKHALLLANFEEKALITVIQERFMEHAKVKFNA